MKMLTWTLRVLWSVCLWFDMAEIQNSPMTLIKFLHVKFKTIGNVRKTSRWRNVYASSAILTALYRITRRQIFYGDLISLETLKCT
jgi:hypothetical protein